MYSKACFNCIFIYLLKVDNNKLLSVYSSCPSFVYVCFVRDMAGLGSNKICTQRPIVGDV